MSGRLHAGAWHALADYLGTRGPQTVFALPGDDLTLLRALAGTDVTTVLCRDQRTATFMATGYAMQSGRPAVCVIGKGPALTNALTGLLEARCSGVPLVVVAGGTAADRRGSGAFQELDQLPLAAALTKWSTRVDDPARVAPAIATAFRIAAHGAPGPVYLELPDHLLAAPVPQPHPWPEDPVVADAVAGVSAGGVLAMIDDARRPVVLVGGGMRHTADPSLLTGFAHRIGAALVATASGRGVVDENDPAFCGLAGLYALPPARSLWAQADLVIALGSRLEETATFPAGFAAPDVPVIQVDVDPAGWSADVDGACVLGDGGAVVGAWLRALGKAADVRPPEGSDVGRDRSRWDDEIARCRRELLQSAEARRSEMAGSDRLHVAELLAEVDATVAPDRILVQENGLQDMWSYFFPYWVCGAAAGSIVPSEQTTLGFGVAAAGGVALAAAGRPVVALVGDGAFGAAHNELRTLVEAGAPVLYLVLRNGGYGWLEHQWQQLGPAGGPARFVRPAAPVCVPTLDGLWHMVLDAKVDLPKALAEAAGVVRGGRVAVLEIPVQLDDVPPGIADLDGDFPGGAHAQVPLDSGPSGTDAAGPGNRTRGSE